MSYPFEDCKNNFKDLDDRSADPDVEDCEDCKNDGPDDAEGQNENGREDSVEPELGLAEQDERQSPQGVETMSRTWLSQNIREVELKYSKTRKYLTSGGRSVQELSANCFVEKYFTK